MAETYRFPKGVEVGLSDTKIAQAAEIGRRIAEQRLAPLRVKTGIILAIVEAAFELPDGAIKSKTRTYKTVRPRQIAYWLARETLGYSFPRIALCLDRHHSSVMQGIKTLEKHMEIDRCLRETCEELRSAVLALIEDE